MDYIIIITMIVVFLTGFVFLDEICVLFSPNDMQDDLYGEKSSAHDSKHALVFGIPPYSTDIVKILKNKSISYTLIQNANDLDKSGSYNYLFAVHESDLENLMFCSIGKNMMGIKQIVALCNCSYNKKIFEDNNILYLCKDNFSAYQFVSALLSSQNAGGHKQCL